MKRQPQTLSHRYQVALRRHLQQGQQPTLKSTRGLGSQALAGGLRTLDLAKLHEQTLVELLPGCPARKRAGLIKRAATFFAMAITPIEKELTSAQETTAHLKEFIETLSQRTVELAASNLELSLEIKQREAAEAALKQSERHYSRLLKQSEHLQEQLRRLSRQILSAQEDERRKISRELHDVIAQTLTGINVGLATLKKEASLNTKGLDRNIIRTQRLVEHSVNIVHKFARELRPSVLDDLGLVPALHTFMKTFTERTGVRTRLTTFAGVKDLDTTKRTVLYRVAQEAMTNVARHAKASCVEVSIQKLSDSVRMSVKDDGKSFQVERVLQSRGRKHLGLLGMKERLEMIGGLFTIKSTPGHGTVVEAQIPSAKGSAGKSSRKTRARSPMKPSLELL